MSPELIIFICFFAVALPFFSLGAYLGYRLAEERAYHRQRKCVMRMKMQAKREIEAIYAEAEATGKAIERVSAGYSRQNSRRGRGWHSR